MGGDFAELKIDHGNFSVKTNWALFPRLRASSAPASPAKNSSGHRLPLYKLNRLLRPKGR